ncbi:hypothetical protein MKZ08_22255 [Viridibacillus sp. FSL R5-0477]|uniref:Uncharacterized protein n=1 Tax=Viridibacillus arenosi FSL R5-213 TaxID=1227360 RepID=W4F837_9BACL|nr:MULTISPECIES: hypothetical protein [Viridibacillus]ETT88291.1 hypothetical protein C176_01929 [Viridibacillus arenosi FSL R5-213]
MSIKDKYNKNPKEAPKSKGNRDVVSKLLQQDNEKIQEIANTDIQVSVNAVERKIKKATFELDADLHKRLRAAAALEECTMLDIVDVALKEYLDKLNR